MSNSTREWRSALSSFIDWLFIMPSMLVNCSPRARFCSTCDGWSVGQLPIAGTATSGDSDSAGLIASSYCFAHRSRLLKPLRYVLLPLSLFLLYEAVLGLLVVLLLLLIQGLLTRCIFSLQFFVVARQRGFGLGRCLGVAACFEIRLEPTSE